MSVETFKEEWIMFLSFFLESGQLSPEPAMAIGKLVIEFVMVLMQVYVIILFLPPINIFPPRPAKTIPFVIYSVQHQTILLSKARWFYSSRESLWVGKG